MVRLRSSTPLSEGSEWSQRWEALCLSIFEYWIRTSGIQVSLYSDRFARTSDLVILSETSYFKQILSPLRRLWPFFLAATLSYLFYTSVFCGGFSRTLWYFSPHVFLASAAIAAFSAAIHSIEILSPTNGLMGVLLIALVLDWISPLFILFIDLIALLIYLIIVVSCRSQILSA